MMLSLRSVKVDERLRDVSLELASGEIVVLVGPNGSGKSSTLAVASGELATDAGDVMLDGRGVAEFTAEDLSRMRALLPQNHGMGFDFSIRDVVALGRIPRGRDNAVVDAVLDAFALTAQSTRGYLSLSGGEQQRVQLARVVAQIWPGEKGTLLLLDEPGNHLDLKHALVSWKLLRELASRGVAVLAAMHDVNQAAHLADRVVVLRDGASVASGSPWEVLTEGLVEAVFGVRGRRVGEGDERAFVWRIPPASEGPIG
ncbi:MAG: ATP-binding cassette domain-containing protein [Gammaproteobacteria bacterium]|jgi:iron complex transport system ATP-binding protein